MLEDMDKSRVIGEPEQRRKFPGKTTKSVGHLWVDKFDRHGLTIKR